MSRAHPPWIVALLIAALAGGCMAASRKGAGAGGSGGEEETGGSSGNTGGKSGGTGGSGAGGQGGGSPGTGGSSATGGSPGGFADAGSPSDAGAAGGAGGSIGTADGGFSPDAPAGPPPPPDAAPSPCTVAITPITPQRLAGLPTGSRLRVEATAGGAMAPKMPAWQWTVQHENTLSSITPTTVEMNPAVVEFTLTMAGTYSITARAMPGCQETVRATALSNPVASFWLRVTPPAGASVQPMEKIIVDVPAGRSVTRDLTLGLGVPIEIDPQNESGARAIYSYLRITGENSTVRLEGHTGRGPFKVRLDSTLIYNVLVVPDTPVGVTDTPVAPLLFRGTPLQIDQNQFKLDPGVAVSGQVTGAGGPVPGARVLLNAILPNAGPVPSTTGLAGTSGQFDLRARAGNFAAVIIPPPKSGLPEARLPAGSGLILYDPLPARVGLDFQWDALASSTLDLTITDSAGQPVKSAVRVRLESTEDALPKVGTLTLTLDRQYPFSTSGFVQLTATSDARGVLTFADVPRGTYLATLSPLDGSAAITTVPVNLAGGASRVPQTVRLVSKVALTGKLLPASLTSGARMVALDAEADPALPPPAAIVDPTGGYVLRIDPGRSYALVLEAFPARSLPRTFLRSIVAPTKDTVREDTIVPMGVSVSGLVTDNAGTPVPGSRVEAYCIGRPPSCIDAQSPDTTVVRPTAEAISDGEGAYRLVVPDPKVAN